MIIQQPTITASISGDNIKSNPLGSYIGFSATSSNPTASNEVVLGINVTGSGNNSITLGNPSTLRTRILNSIETTVDGTYIGYSTSASNSTASNEVVLGIGITGSGNNTVTLGNTNTIHTEIYGSIYKHQNLIGDNTVTHNLEKFYVYTLSGSFTASLPPSPISGDSIKLSNLSTTQTGSDRGEITASAARILIGRNGKNIMGYARDMELDYFSPSFELIYSEPTDGWVIISS